VYSLTQSLSLTHSAYMMPRELKLALWNISTSTNANTSVTKIGWKKFPLLFSDI